MTTILKQLSQQDFLDIVESAVKDMTCATMYLLETKYITLKINGRSIPITDTTVKEARGLRWDYLIGDISLVNKREFLISYADQNSAELYFVEISKVWKLYIAEISKVKHFAVHDFEEKQVDLDDFKKSNLELTLQIDVACGSELENDSPDDKYTNVTITTDKTKDDSFSKSVLDKIKSR